MRRIRAKAAALVAIFIALGGNSHHGQVVESDVIQADHDSEPTSLAALAESLRSSIGLKVGQRGFDADADLNNDGMVNAVDVSLWRLGRGKGNVPAMGGTDSGDGAGPVAAVTERVMVEGQTIFASPGTKVSVLFVIRDNTTPILGYTIDANAVAQSGATGAVTVDVLVSNFYDVRNLITTGGAMRDPFFSIIEDNGSGGVSVTTITSDLSTVQAVDNVNDGLAQVFFDVPKDALGEFTIQLGSGSVLVDGNAATVPFAFTPGTIHVTNSIPAASDWGMIVLGLLIVSAGYVVFARRSGVAGWKMGEC